MFDKAGQEFFEGQNRLWVDLHTCATASARAIFETKLEEAYRYGVESVEFIFGTPDRHEGSIQQELLRACENGHHFIDHYGEIHAGVIAWLRVNPSPAPRDSHMSFSGIKPEYDHGYRRKHEYHYALYPYRRSFSSAELSEQLGISLGLLLKVAGSGFRGTQLPDAECRTVWDPVRRQNRKAWLFTQRDAEALVQFLTELRSDYERALAGQGVSVAELSLVIRSTGSIVAHDMLPRHAKLLLTRVRKSREKEVRDSPEAHPERNE
jgi:hypothetical protein